MLIVSGVIVWVISELPYVGGIVSFIISVLGLGVLVSAILPKKAKKASDIMGTSSFFYCLLIN